MNDVIGSRMKEFYEEVPKIKLMRRTPVIIRIDGKAFHTFTRGFKRPFDDVLVKTMQETTKYLCENIQGCVLGYTQSDEISLLLIDYQKLETSAWFDYEVQKMCSIASSMATMAFNKFFLDNVDLDYNREFYTRGLDSTTNFSSEDEHLKATEQLEQDYDIYYRKVNKAMFDARVFNMPREEVTNYFYWRQLDAMRNSTQMIGRVYFTNREMKNKSNNEIVEMLSTQEGVELEDYSSNLRIGTCVIKTHAQERVAEVNYDIDGNVVGTSTTVRPKWDIDIDIPIFKGENRDYIEHLVML